MTDRHQKWKNQEIKSWWYLFWILRPHFHFSGLWIWYYESYGTQNVICICSIDTLAAAYYFTTSESSFLEGVVIFTIQLFRAKSDFTLSRYEVVIEKVRFLRLKGIFDLSNIRMKVRVSPADHMKLVQTFSDSVELHRLVRAGTQWFGLGRGAAHSQIISHG